jgi:tRNA A-37 threonylcarbamoyl transferase component Bud32/membrane-associated phospholipid phosphatase
MGTVRADEPPGTPIRPVVAAPPTGRRRRPSGEPPPLPRQLDRETLAHAVAVLATAALQVALLLDPLRARITRLDLSVLRLVEQVRVAPVVDALDTVLRVTGQWPVRLLFLTTVVVLLAARHVRHLIAYLAVLLLTALAVSALAVLQGRMRPAGVDVVGDWTGFSHPSLPVALLALVAVGAVRTLAPAGQARRRATAVAAGAVLVLAASRLYLGLDHPTDVLAALGIGWALPMAVFGLALPDAVFPLTYRGGTRAHVELAGARGAAVVRALEQQLGLRATSIEPFGLAGSAGSMPLRVVLEQEVEGGQAVFGKLYTVTHLRSDRWYKLARMVLYGRLEDEKPFSTVRRLVEYEDHMLRLLRDAGLPVPTPFGLVEITPEREYVVVMSFFEGAREVGDVPLTDEEIDDGLRIVRRLWEAGVAHRDLKPSNLLARDGRLLLIDVAFATVRPTPWRQAVDLANMMLTLALSSSADRVYARALRQFAPDDVAEAFAATRSLTVPSQLRARLKADGRELPSRFRELAPRRPPVAIQLWSVRRALVTVAVLAGAVGLVGTLVVYARVVNLL